MDKMYFLTAYFVIIVLFSSVVFAVPSVEFDEQAKVFSIPHVDFTSSLSGNDLLISDNNWTGVNYFLNVTYLNLIIQSYTVNGSVNASDFCVNGTNCLSGVNGSYVPYIGANKNVNLGVNNFSVNASNALNLCNNGACTLKWNYTGDVFSIVHGYNFSNSTTYSTRIGIGTDIPEYQLEIMNQRSAFQGGADRGLVLSQYVSAVASPQITFKRSRGTKAIPTTVAVNDLLGNFWTIVYNGTDWVQGTATWGWKIVTVNTSGVFSDLYFNSKPSGTVTFPDGVVMIIKSNGNVGYGTINPDYRVTVNGTGVNISNPSLNAELCLNGNCINDVGGTYGELSWEAGDGTLNSTLPINNTFYNFSNSTTGYSLNGLNRNFVLQNGNSLVAQVSGVYGFNGAVEYQIKSQQILETTLFVNGVRNVNYTTIKRAPISIDVIPTSVQNATTMTAYNNDLLYEDGTGLTFNELSGTPPVLEANFTFSNITDNPLFLKFAGYYLGSDGHAIEVQAWNFTGGAWVNFRDATKDIPNSGLIPFTQVWKFPDTIQNSRKDFINSSQNVLVRIVHTSSGINTHMLFVDQFALQTRMSYDRQAITGNVRLNAGDTIWIEMMANYDNAMPRINRFNINLNKRGS